MVKKVMEQKFVSVIMPVYNGEKYLRRAIESVLAQTYSSFELIVVDDGSTDNSREIASSFGDKIRHICQENKGLGGARNTGILASCAEFVGLLDADDEWMPNYLEKMMRLVRHHPNAAVYYCTARGMDSNGNNLPRIFGRVIKSIDQRLLRANFIIPSTVILRRSVIVDIGLFEQDNRDIHGCEDWDLWLRLLPSHPFVGTTETLVRYRLHSNTFSANSDHMQKAVKAVIEKNFGLDDGNYTYWIEDKKRAFGGVYRYQALMSVQKKGDWTTAIVTLLKAFEIDPTLTIDLDLFYDLAFGARTSGDSDVGPESALVQNYQRIMSVLERFFDEHLELESLRNMARGTAYYAIGLVAYNVGRKDLSKRFLSKALALSPRFLLNPRIDQRIDLILVKSFISLSWIKNIKQFFSGKGYAG